MDILQQDSSSQCKLCKTCLHLLPATAEYFHRDKYSKDGLCSSCKECKKTARRAYYIQNAEKAKAYSKEYVANNREHTVQYQKRYAEQHQAELRAYKKAYHAKHQEQLIARSRQWYAEHKRQVSENGKRYREEHAEEKRERDRKYKEEHKSELIEQSKQYYAEHRDERLAYIKQYYQTERGIIAKRAHAHNRRARKKKASGSHTTEQLYQQLKSQEGKCFYCQVELRYARNSWHADHVVPLSRGGSNDISNIVISCPKCNRKKHAKLPHEWANELSIDPTERL